MRNTFYFFPVGADVEGIVTDWLTCLKVDLLYGPDDPLFPATKVGVGENGLFGALGLTRQHWSDAGAIRRIFRTAFESVGLPYFNPHSFRKTLTVLGEQLCGSPESFKAWSQNLGHDQVLTTFTSYGGISTRRQAEILESLTADPTSPSGFRGMERRHWDERFFRRFSIKKVNVQPSIVAPILLPSFYEG